MLCCALCFVLCAFVLRDLIVRGEEIRPRKAQQLPAWTTCGAAAQLVARSSSLTKHQSVKKKRRNEDQQPITAASKPAKFKRLKKSKSNEIRILRHDRTHKREGRLRNVVP
ncbi:uncharacterized protein UTRI_02628 [Ustilago trichophora]|uniref:Secreted protein n=1 Tax=Ustilago trichophora TaxID=86804 RepID=A0A5C3ERM1_9BASI|nr:uncharacterized protein UTRI_02628 [Ustilago trichophora]